MCKTIQLLNVLILLLVSSVVRTVDLANSENIYIQKNCLEASLYAQLLLQKNLELQQVTTIVQETMKKVPVLNKAQSDQTLFELRVSNAENKAANSKNFWGGVSLGAGVMFIFAYILFPRASVSVNGASTQLAQNAINIDTGLFNR